MHWTPKWRRLKTENATKFKKKKTEKKEAKKRLKEKNVYYYNILYNNYCISISGII